MTWYFLDASALLKRYHLETGSDAIHTLFDDPSASCVTSRLALLDVQSVLAGQQRMGKLLSGTVSEVRNHWLSEVRERKLFVLAFRAYHFRIAARLLVTHGLALPMDTLSAVHLASAMDLRARGRADVVVTANAAFGAVAKQAGFLVMNPENRDRRDDLD